MASIDVQSAAGKKVGSVDLPADIFGIEPNVAVMHQVVTAQLAAARAGTHSTRTRAEVSGGGAKPWKQKGTGRARQGSTRAPHWRGGGIAHGPKPRDYSQRTPKKMVRLALRSALSDRAAEGKVIVIDSWGIEAPRTKDAKAAVAALGIVPGQRVLVVLDRDEAVWRSFRNLHGEQRVQPILVDELSAYDVLVNDAVILTTTTLEAVVLRLSTIDKRVPETAVSVASATSSSGTPSEAPAAASSSGKSSSTASDASSDTEGDAE